MSSKYDHLWQDKRNWKLGVFYHCPQDPRVIVPKRIWWTGWTVNFARPMGVPAIFLSIGAAGILLLLLILIGIANPLLLIGIMVIVMIVARKMASR